MSRAVLEAVPNFSEGRREKVVNLIAARVEAAGDIDLVDRHVDPDHNRCVLTLLGPPEAVEDAALEAARAALELIDLSDHEGVHPRIGALDVLPLIPLTGLTLAQVADIARRLARRIADEVGIPVYLYGRASDPPGRPLFELRRRESGGESGPRTPDVVPAAWGHQGLHPTAGAVCVGARGPLLAWNVYLEGEGDERTAREIAARIRETGGGFPGLRALGLSLESRARVQVSMNLERPGEVAVDEVYAEIDRLARERDARAGEIEVVGLIPDEAAHAFRRLGWPDVDRRVISYWLARQDHGPGPNEG